MADEGLHEIQLNGKQLVFLFMASTVVAVVIFLCGVMVGRGVRAQRASELTEASADAGTDPTAVTQTPPEATTAASSSSTLVSSQETLTYPSRLEGQEPPEETLKEPVAPVPTTLAAPAAAPAKPAPAKVPQVGRASSGPPEGAPAKGAPVNAAPAKSAQAGRALSGSPEGAPAKAAQANTAPSTVTGEPAGNGFVVQVAAVNDRREAETIARRLAGKGYPSFVTTPGNGAPRMFRVRIGKYTNRREAESIANRLEKEEQFKPWITR